MITPEAAMSNQEYCDVDESKNPLGANRCDSSFDCKGQRTCGASGYCNGEHGCDEEVDQEKPGEEVDPEKTD